jgi:hypothetical protein
MSNNIYDILKKMQNLEAPKQSLTESKKSKPDYIDLDKDGDTNEPMKKAAKEKSKGAIAEAVARVEKQLAEKYQGFKKLGENEYDKYSEVQPEHIKARPGSSDPMGTADYQTGIKPDPDDTLLGVYGPKAQITPKISGIAPEKRSDVLRQKYNNRLGSGQQRDDIFLNEPKGNETYNDLLKGADHYTSFSPKKPSMMDRAKSALGLDEGEYNEDMLSPGQKKIARMSPPPNKIDAGDLAKLRTDKKGMKKEGNAFSGAVAKAKASGQDEFNVGGKEYEVQEGIEDTLQNILPKSMQPFNNQTAAAASKAQAPVKEGFPTVDDAKKRMDAKAGKTAHGTKTVTKTGVKHERNYDADEPTGERGRPKKDKFAK